MSCPGWIGRRRRSGSSRSLEAFFPLNEFSLSLRERVGVRAIGEARQSSLALTLPSPGGRGMKTKAFEFNSIGDRGGLHRAGGGGGGVFARGGPVGGVAAGGAAVAWAAGFAAGRDLLWGGLGGVGA